MLMDMLDQLVISEIISTFVSSKFMRSAMVQLSKGGQTNVLYNLAKRIGRMRPDKKDS